MSAVLKQKEINRLLNNTPSPAHADARIRLQGFIEAAAPFDVIYIQRAVTKIVNAELPDVSPSFPIFPAQLVAVARNLRDRDIARRQIHQGAVLQIMDRGKDFHEQPVEVRRKAVSEGLARLITDGLPDSPQVVAEKRAAAKLESARHDAYFVDMSEDAIRKRLITR